MKKPEMVTKKANMSLTDFNFNLVSKKAPDIPPTIAEGTNEKSLLSNEIYPLKRYRAKETIDMGIMVATAFAKTPFSSFWSFRNTCARKYVIIIPPPAPKSPFTAPASAPIMRWSRYFLTKFIKNLTN